VTTRHIIIVPMLIGLLAIARRQARAALAIAFVVACLTPVLAGAREFRIVRLGETTWGCVRSIRWSWLLRRSC